MDLTAVQRRTLEGLIGLGRPPDLDSDLAVRVRARLEEGLRQAGLEEAGWTAGRPLWLGKGALADLDRCSGLFLARIFREGPPFEHSAASGAGALFHRAIGVDVATERAADLRSVCERAARGLADTDRSFGSFWAGLDLLDRGELLAEAERHLTLFRDSFPSLLRTWQPATELPLKARLSEGRVVLSGAPDLVLGRTRRLVIDFKSGGAWPEHPEDARFYALLLLLRVGVAPYRVATSFLQSGEWQAEDVTEETLHHAVDRVLAAVRAAVRVGGGSAPELRPGPHCSWCPRASTCPSARLHLPDVGGEGVERSPVRVVTAR